jgi:CRP-like cAMP-binding protein
MAVDPSRIRSVPLFAPLTEEERVETAALLEEREVHAGRRLTTEGGGGYFFFVIESGTAEVTNAEGAVLAHFGPGDFFGEAAIFRTRRRTATVTATSDLVVFAMFGADFAVLVDKIPALHDTIDKAMAERLP